MCGVFFVATFIDLEIRLKLFLSFLLLLYLWFIYYCTLAEAGGEGGGREGRLEAELNVI